MTKMETTEAIRKYIRFQTAYGLVIIITLIVMVAITHSENPLKWIFPTIFLLFYLQGTYRNYKIYRDPNNVYYDSTLMIDNDVLVIKNPTVGNCQTERRIKIDRIKSIELIRRCLKIRLDGFVLDFQTSFRAADKGKLEQIVQNIGNQSGITVKIK